MILLLLACTDSKTVAPSPDLVMRRYADAGFDRCLALWTEALRNAEPTVSSGRLYKGGYWSSATQARVYSSLAMRTMVVSAGLGITEIESPVPSYAATFTPGHPDSVPTAETSDGGRRWWRGLGAYDQLSATVEALDQPRLLAALPERYLNVVTPSLREIGAELGTDRIVVLGSGMDNRLRQELSDSWVQLDARMSRVVGGPAGQITARVLKWLTERTQSEDDVRPDRVREMIEPLLDPNSPPLYPKRTRCTEDDVRQWTLGALASDDPPTSATNALRRFRDEGFAFEQKRFGRVYRSVTSEIGETG